MFFEVGIDTDHIQKKKRYICSDVFVFRSCEVVFVDIYAANFIGTPRAMISNHSCDEVKQNKLTTERTRVLLVVLRERHSTWRSSFWVEVKQYYI